MDSTSLISAGNWAKKATLLSIQRVFSDLPKSRKTRAKLLRLGKWFPFTVILMEYVKKIFC